MHHLKKYPNRRLYDTTDSRYVTIDDVRKLIVKGESIEVEDSRDGKNITRAVLLQILSDQEAQGHEPILTNRAIEQIIRLYGDRMGSFISRYLEQSILLYIDQQDQLRTRMRTLNELNPLNMVRQVFDAARSTSSKTRAGDPPASTPSSSADGTASNATNESPDPGPDGTPAGPKADLDQTR